MYWPSSSAEEVVAVGAAWFHGVNTGSSSIALSIEVSSGAWAGEARVLVVASVVVVAASAEPEVKSGLAPVVL